jgi:hypothetical protein
VYLKENVMVYDQVGILKLIGLQSGFSAISLKERKPNKDLWNNQEKVFPGWEFEILIPGPCFFNF